MINKLFLLLFTKRIKSFKTTKFSISFPEFWRKSLSLKNAYIFFDEYKNYGLIIENYSSKKISAEKILENYAKKYPDCIIKPVEDLINNNKLLKWVFNYEKVNVLEYKRLIVSNQVILDISYCIPKDLSATELKKASDNLEYIINSINFK